jgi:hypothetical protein
VSQLALGRIGFRWSLSDGNACTSRDPLVADERILTFAPVRGRDTSAGYNLRDMTEVPSGRIAVEFTTAEAKLIVAALRQFEPFWRSDMDDMGRAELLAGIRQGIEHVSAVIDPANAPIS